MTTSLLTLKLAINIEGGLQFTNRKANADFLRIQKKIWERDQYTCRFCGFHADKYQEVVNIDADYHNNHVENLATACIFCAHTQLIGLKNGSKIICLPDISQVDLNHLIRVLFCSTYYGELQAETAKTLIQALRQRYAVVENFFGRGTSDSLLFAQTYIDAVGAEMSTDDCAAILTQLRWLPSRVDYEDIIHYWADNILTREMLEHKIAKSIPRGTRDGTA